MLVAGCCTATAPTTVSVVETTSFWPIALLTVVARPVTGVTGAARVVITVGLWRVVVTGEIALTSAAGSMVALATLATCWLPLSPPAAGTGKALTRLPDKNPGKGASKRRMAPRNRMMQTIAPISAKRGVNNASERCPTTWADSAMRALASSICTSIQPL